MSDDQHHDVSLRAEVHRIHGRYHITIKLHGSVLFTDGFEDFCEMDKRMRTRLGLVWGAFREEARMKCDL